MFALHAADPLARRWPWHGHRHRGTAETAEPVVHILWMNGGLGCDGDSVALTAATQPSIEEIVLGTLPGCRGCRFTGRSSTSSAALRRGADKFIRWWHTADRGELDPFVLVVEGSIPNEAIKEEGYWCGSATTRPPASR